MTVAGRVVLRGVLCCAAVARSQRPSLKLPSQGFAQESSTAACSQHLTAAGEPAEALCRL